MSKRLVGNVQRLKQTRRYLKTVAILFAAFTVSIFSAPVVTQAISAPLSIPFGGFVTGIVIPPPPLVSVCPEYTLIANVTPGDPPIMGLYLPPGGALLLYDYKNIYTPLNPLLGYYDPLPTPCGVGPGFPIFPITYIPPFYFAGTGQ
jgi:hypothetical protein